VLSGTLQENLRYGARRKRLAAAAGAAHREARRFVAGLPPTLSTPGSGTAGGSVALTTKAWLRQDPAACG
jgi:hypothetical protein